MKRAAFPILFLLPLAASAQDIHRLEEEAVKAAVDRVAPGVLKIETFGGLEKVGELLVGEGPTTGLAVSEDGYFLSSAFNFVQQPSSILVTLPSGNRAAAEIVAHDRARMLVLLKVNSEEPLVVPAAVPREEMTVGQWAIAVGRTYDSERPSISAGVISAVNRIWGKAIQTDAKVSPANYGGPLVDIRGRVLGVLVPMSPQGQGEIAGAEWYDSGIGFAVPLAEVLPHLETMKQGQDLEAGLLGVSLKGSNPFADKAVIAAIPAKSPAAAAGLKIGDEIVEADGKPIVRIAQLRHALGSHYAGDKINVVAKRGEERIAAEVELVAKVEPFRPAFLGVLPLRDGEEAGFVVRYVYEGSPAAKAGLQAGDRLVELEGKAIADLDSAYEALAAVEASQQVTLKFERGEEQQTAEVELAAPPTDIPAELPAARKADPAEAADKPAVGLVEVNIPEERNKCAAYVPESYHPDVRHGLVVWLHEPGKFDSDALVERWKEHCEENSLILLAPQSADPARWQPTETAFIQKTIDDVLGRYSIDRRRIVVHGYQAGGSMAFLTAFEYRALIRGVAAVDGAVPARAQVPAVDPVERLAVYSAAAEGSRIAPAIKAGLKKLTDANYPVTERSLGSASRPLNDEELAELVRWMDSLDRL